jgi:hypothetical protein
MIISVPLHDSKEPKAPDVAAASSESERPLQGHIGNPESLFYPPPQKPSPQFSHCKHLCMKNAVLWVSQFWKATMQKFLIRYLDHDFF